MKCLKCGNELENETKICECCEKNADETNNEQINQSFAEEVSSQTRRKRRIISWVAGAILLLTFILLVRGNTTEEKFSKYVDQGEYTHAKALYVSCNQKEKQEIEAWGAKYFEDTIEQYNNDEIKYEKAYELVQSLEEVLSQTTYSTKIKNLLASRAAFTHGEENFARMEWEKAKEEYEKVIEEDKNYNTAIKNIVKCRDEISIASFNKAQQYEAEGNWVEALNLYEKVEVTTAEEYKKASERKQICAENLKNNAKEQLDGLYAEGKYEEGLALIENLERYLFNDEMIKIHKENFRTKKQEADLIKEQNKYNTGITYEQLARYPEEYKNQYVKFYGKVLQVQSSTGTTIYRIGTGGSYYYDDVIYAVQRGDNTQNRVLEDDFVTIYGKSSGLYTYETVMGASVTIPGVAIDRIDR